MVVLPHPDGPHSTMTSTPACGGGGGPHTVVVTYPSPSRVSASSSNTFMASAQAASSVRTGTRSVAGCSRDTVLRRTVAPAPPTLARRSTQGLSAAAPASGSDRSVTLTVKEVRQSRSIREERFSWVFADPRTARPAQRRSVRVLQHERRRAVGAENNEAVRLQEAGEGRVARRHKHVGQPAALNGAAQRDGHHECQPRLHAVAEVVKHDAAALRRQRQVGARSLPAAQHAERLQPVRNGVEATRPSDESALDGVPKP